MGVLIIDFVPNFPSTRPLYDPAPNEPDAKVLRKSPTAVALRKQVGVFSCGTNRPRLASDPDYKVSLLSHKHKEKHVPSKAS